MVSLILKHSRTRLHEVLCFVELTEHRNRLGLGLAWFAFLGRAFPNRGVVVLPHRRPWSL